MDYKHKQESGAGAGNDAVPFFLLAMKARCPIPQEPEDYPSLQEALYFLREITRLSLADMAFRIGVNATTLSNVEAGNLYSGMSLESLENVAALASECHLPRMWHFLKMLMILTRQNRHKATRKPKRTTLREEEHAQSKSVEKYF